MKNEVIRLVPGKKLITERDAAYMVTGGVVNVYIVPIDEGRSGRRVFVTEVRAGDVFPSLTYMDRDYRKWRFCAASASEASVTLIKDGCTGVLKRRFAEKTGIGTLESFEEAACDMYKRSIVAEDALLLKTVKDDKKTHDETERLIDGVFSKKNSSGLRGESPIYRAAYAVCTAIGLHIAPEELVKECRRTVDLEAVAEISGFAVRKVSLSKNWQRSDAGAIIAFDADGSPTALIPSAFFGYTVIDTATGKKRHAGRRFCDSLNTRAYAVYRTVGPGPHSTGALARFALRAVSVRDIVLSAFSAVVGALACLLLPVLAIDAGAAFAGSISPVLVSAGLAASSVLLASIFIRAAGAVSSFRISSRVAYDVGCAAALRLTELPFGFFEKYGSSRIAEKVLSAGPVAGGVAAAGINAVADLAAGTACIIYLFVLEPILAGWALASSAASTAFFVMLSRRAERRGAKADVLDADAFSRLNTFTAGIEKIRTSGASDRALGEYLRPLASSVAISLGQGRDKRLLAATVIFGLSWGVLCTSPAAQADDGIFAACAALLITLAVAVTGFGGCAARALRLMHCWKTVIPLFAAETENDAGAEPPGIQSGNIDINNVSFAYEGGGNVLGSLSLSIKRGELIGIAGGSGSGKTTLLSLLLGFIKPDAGKIYFDGRDMARLDLRELRRQFGVVLQDGGLISGSILDNITVTAPWADDEDVAAAVSAAGLDDDIRKMPMGLDTVIGAGSPSVSGGQRQRILIARALMGAPHILMFDEATEALNTEAAAGIAELLKSMTMTRIVVAHSAVMLKGCDRVIVLDGGRIAEEGTFDALMEKKGKLFELFSEEV